MCVQKILCYDPLDFFGQKVFYICVDNLTKFRDQSQTKSAIRGTLILHGQCTLMSQEIPGEIKRTKGNFRGMMTLEKFHHGLHWSLF